MGDFGARDGLRFKRTVDGDGWAWSTVFCRIKNRLTSILNAKFDFHVDATAPIGGIDVNMNLDHGRKIPQCGEAWQTCSSVFRNFLASKAAGYATKYLVDVWLAAASNQSKELGLCRRPGLIR